jgi:hypothetical protein
VKSSSILEHGNNFGVLNFFGKIIIIDGKPSMECGNGLIDFPFQGIEFCKIQV